jgi:hypothetical protein
MKFLEKDLETLIWENTETCYERGLDIQHVGKYLGDCRFRQLHLGPYGIADLINTRYYPLQQTLHIQVIECKKDEINLTTYAQAKRYLTAVKDVVCHHYGISGPDCYITHELVLIGRRFEASGDFPFVYNDDRNCKAYTYDYDIDGLRFTPIPRTWTRSLKNSDNALAAFTASFSEEISGTSRYEQDARAQYAAGVLANGDAGSPLLVTSQGVLVNTAMLDRFNEEVY